MSSSSLRSPFGMEYILKRAWQHERQSNGQWLVALELAIRNPHPRSVTEYAVPLYARIEANGNTRPAVLGVLPYRLGVLHLAPGKVVHGRLYFRVTDADLKAASGLTLVVQDAPESNTAPSRLPVVLLEDIYKAQYKAQQER